MLICIWLTKIITLMSKNELQETNIHIHTYLFTPLELECRNEAYMAYHYVNYKFLLQLH